MYRPFGRARTAPISAYIQDVHGKTDCTTETTTEESHTSDLQEELSSDGTRDAVSEKCNAPDHDDQPPGDGQAEETEYMEVRLPMHAMPVFLPMPRTGPSTSLESIAKEEKELAGLHQSIQDLTHPISKMEAHLSLAASAKGLRTSSSSLHTSDEADIFSKLCKLSPGDFLDLSQVQGSLPMPWHSPEDAQSVQSPACRIKPEGSRDVRALLVNRICEKVDSLEQRMNDLEVKLVQSIGSLRDHVDQKLALHSHVHGASKDQVQSITTDCLAQEHLMEDLVSQSSAAVCENMELQIEQGSPLGTPVEPIRQAATVEPKLSDLSHATIWYELSPGISSEVSQVHLAVDAIKRQNDIVEELVKDLQNLDNKSEQTEAYSTDASARSDNPTPHTHGAQQSVLEVEKTSFSELADELEGRIPSESRPDHRLLLRTVVENYAHGPYGSKCMSV